MFAGVQTDAPAPGGAVPRRTETTARTPARPAGRDAGKAAHDEHQGDRRQRDDEIEPGPVSQDAVEKLHHQSAIRRAQAVGRERMVEDFVGSGRVSYEYRSFPIHGIDVPLTMLAQCGGPQTFFPLAAKLWPLCAALGTVLGLAGLWLGLFVAPTDFQQGEGYRIIFVHVPASWMSMVIYLAMAFWSLLGLTFNTRLSGMMTRALAPTGALFAFLSLWQGWSIARHRDRTLATRHGEVHRGAQKHAVPTAKRDASKAGHRNLRWTAAVHRPSSAQRWPHGV